MGKPRKHWPNGFLHEDDTKPHSMTTWQVTIGDGYTEHCYRFKASNHLSINVMYSLLRIALRMGGYAR